MRKFAGWTLLLALAGLLALPLSRALAAEPAAVEDLLPESTTVLLKVSDWTKTRKELDGTALGKILAEEDVKAYLKGLEKFTDRLVAALEKQTGLKKADFEAAFGTELAVAVVNVENVKQKIKSVDADGKATEIETAGTNVTVAVLARVGDAAAADRICATLDGLLKAKVPPVPVAWAGVKGSKFGMGDGPALYTLRAGAWQAWVVGGDARVKTLAEGFAAGKCDKPLSATADFKLCRGKLTARADVLWYAGIKKGLDQVLAVIPEEDRAEVAKVLEALKVGDVGAAAGSLAIEPPGFRSRTFVAMKEGDDGLVGLIGREPLPNEMLKLVPDNATAMMAGGFRIDRVLPLVRKVAESVEAGSAKKMDEGLAEVKTQIGLDVEKDMLNALSGRGLIFALPAQAVGGNPLLGQLNGLVIVLEVKDAVALRGATEKLTAMAVGAMGDDAPMGKDTVTSFEYRGQKATVFNVGMMAPSFAVTDKYLVIGGSVQSVKKVLAQLAGGEGAAGALVDSEKYKKALAAVDAKDAIGVSFMQTSDSVSAAMAGAGMMAGFMMPALSKMRGSARKTGSANNLHQIGMALSSWAGDNDEKYPASLAVLVPDYVDNKKIFLCPNYAKHAADGVDYAYVAGLQDGDPADFIVAYEPAAGPDGMVNAAYIGARVMALKLEDVKKQLEKQSAKLKENKREMKILEPKGVEAGGGAAEQNIEDILNGDALIDLLKQLFNPATMPAPETITKHLFPSVSVTRRVEGGVLSEGFSPLGFSGGLGVGGGSGNVAAVSVIAAIAIPSLIAARRNSYETAGAANMRAYATAQTMFIKTDWYGTGKQYARPMTDLYKLSAGASAGKELMLIDKGFVDAFGGMAGAHAGNPKPKQGYYFYEVMTIGGKAFDLKNDYALCAVPATYGKSGRMTFIITSDGRPLGKDTGGKPVTDYPADPDKDGWKEAD